jgi:hypothetical protein
MHSLVAAEVLALIHGEAAGATAEAVALGSELPTVADFAEELAVVLRAVCRVEQFAAETALKAHLVPFQSTGYALLGGVDRLSALRTLRLFDWLVRHFVFLYTRVYS